MIPASTGVGPIVASGAEYSAGSEAELLDAIADAPDGSIITVTKDIKLTSALGWDDKTLTIKGSSEDVTLERDAGLGSVSMFTIGGTNPSFTVPAGIILENITLNDAGNPDGSLYDGIISAYRQNVNITLDSGASLMNSGGGSSVYIESIAAQGPVLSMLEGSRILYAKGGPGAPGAGVFVGTGSSFTMEGGIIQSNRTSAEGGGVYVADGATFIMENGLVKGNTASAGGGIFVSGGGEGGAFVMKGGSVTGNILSGAPQNKHGEDVAVEMPSGAGFPSSGTSPAYSDAAYSAEIYPDAVVGSNKIGVQNIVSNQPVFNQAVFIPESRMAATLIGALPQFAGTAVLDSLQTAAAAQMPSSDPVYQGLTYAGSVLYSPDSNTGTVTFRLNYPDGIPTYDNEGLNVRNRYCYALAYVALDRNGAPISSVHIITPIRDSANIIAEIPAISGAASYGIAKYNYDKSGAFDIGLATPAGGKVTEKISGAGGTLHFDSVPSGAGFVPSPAAYTLVATPDTGWHIDTVTLIAGDGYVLEKDVTAGGEVTLYYTDLAVGTNTIEAVFVKDDGTIDLSMKDASFVYDGRPHRVAVSGLAKGDEVLYMYRVGDSGFIHSNGNPSFTDVNEVVANGVSAGESNEIIVYAVVTRGAVSAKASAALIISPRYLTVKPVDREKKHDGKPLTPNSVELASGSLVQGHSLDISSAVFGGSRTSVGTSVSTVRGVTIPGTDPANYSISYGTGRLEVTYTYTPGDTPEKDTDNSKENNNNDKNNRRDNNNGSGSGAGTDDNTGSGDGAVPGTDNDANGDGGDTGITDNPTPTVPGADDVPIAGDSLQIWWMTVIAIIIAAAIICLYILYLRRRRENDKGYDN